MNNINPTVAQQRPPLMSQPPMQPTGGLDQSPQPSKAHSRSTSFFGFRNRSTSTPNTAQRHPTRSLSTIAQSANATAAAQQRQGPDEFGRSPALNVPSQNPNGIPANPNQPFPPTAGNQNQPGQQPQQALMQPSQQPQQPLHPEIRSVVHLNLAHAHKVYFSGPLVRRIERQPDGQRPAKDDGWVDVWGQLGGTTLSVWDMKEIAEASKQGKEVPPTYINMTDAFVQVLGSVTVPATPTSPSRRYSNVLTLNTAGSNLILFSCPTTVSLLSWAAALRLSAWEKSRLEEIYTAHQIRTTLGVRDIKPSLIRGQLEGFVRVRFAGHTDWKRMYMVLSGGLESSAESIADSKNKKRTSIFGSRDQPASASGPAKPKLSLFTSPKPKDRKKAFLSLTQVTQAFSVYPERPELIPRSTLMKVEGLMGDEHAAGGMRSREGWWLLMPEMEPGINVSAELLRWVIAIHDVFGLYGRPQSYTWDPRDAMSLMFGYPVGPQKDQLFLDRVTAENLDPREERTSAVRANLLKMLLERMRAYEQQGPPKPGPAPAPASAPAGAGPVTDQPPPRPTDQPQRLQPQAVPTTRPAQQPASQQPQQNGVGPQLPPITFNPSLQPTPPPERLMAASSSMPPGPSIATKPAPQPAAVPVAPVASAPSLPIATRPILHMATRPSEDAIPSRSSPIPAIPVRHPDHVINQTTKPVSQSSPVISRAPEPENLAYDGILTSTSAMDPRTISQAPILSAIPQQNTGGSGSRVQALVPQLPGPSAKSPISPTTFSTLPSPALPSPNRANNGSDDMNNIMNEAGALYYMQLDRGDSVRRPPPSSSADARDTTSAATNASVPQPSVQPAQNSALVEAGPSSSVPTIPTMLVVPTPSASPEPSGPNSSPSRAGLGRKPTGARGAPGSNNTNQASINTEWLDMNNSTITTTTTTGQNTTKMATGIPSADELGDMAAITYMNNLDAPHKEDEEDEEDGSPSVQVELPASSVPAVSPPAIQLPVDGADGPGGAVQYKSTFAPSKQAEQRRIKSQAQQAAHDAAVHRPGRSHGKKKAREAGAWDASSDEEDEEEEEDEEDEEDTGGGSSSNAKPVAGGVSQASTSPTAPTLITALRTGPMFSNSSPVASTPDGTAYAAMKPIRHLPQIPGKPTVVDEDNPPLPQPRRAMTDQYPESSRRTIHDDGQPHIRSQSEFPPPGAARQNIWSQALEAGRNGNAVPEQANNRDTFIQLEPPSHSMTKAFAPTGLLSAGLQDKQDRSAKRQEEIARESGASLVNVPGKAPPPQTGLLGVITAHERDRKREGGVGAALTERERQKRYAEERQRQFDDQSRQLLEQMQTGGMYPAAFGGYNPMMANPMMMGMNPMMAMNPMMTGPMGFPGMMNPQHLFAAQQAAQAYQQAMMSFSVNGSQAGGDTAGNPVPPGGLTPMMTGAMFDPRMSMMGMPMMAPPMVGMPMQMTGQNMAGFSPQMFDPALGGQLPAQFSSPNSSANDRGSPLALPVETEAITRVSRQNSPAPKS